MNEIRWIFGTGEEPETGMTRDDFGILSRMALAKRLSHLLLLFSRPSLSFSPFWASSGLCPPARWIETALPPREIIQSKQLRQSQTFYDALAPRSTHSSSSFCSSPARSPVPSSCTSILNGSRSHICIHIDSYSNFPYWIHLRTWIAQTLLYTTWQTTESCLSGCGRSLNLLHHFCELWLHRYANFELEALDCFEPKLRSFWTRIKRQTIKTGWKGKDVKHSSKIKQTD